MARIKFLKIQITLLILFVGVACFSSMVFADCRGCCAGHQGITCVNGVTRCLDETPLSANCLNKSCNVCADETTATPGDTIKIANFNIQVFGRTKAKKAEVMEILANTISRFDVVAVQEIRDKTGNAVKDLEVAVDNLGTNYDFIAGPRLGRTSSKEQYAYFYRVSTIAVQGFYTYDDSANDVFHREPFIAKFKAKNGNFDFILITIHTDPDHATSEIKALDSTVADAKEHFSNETDIIILGDLNADCSYFDENETNYPLRGSGYKWLIENDMDTNVAGSSCTYDRIITTSAVNQDYAGVAKVFRFDLEFDLDCEAKEVSDHYPVFAEFNISNDTD